ncbi:SIS domain-containing protein [Thalassobaculum salexigens]|uniref:SIS domain-containing protein n=1 Tax=Thalassobaculum salexigens TaxID=455360 RepID=UPI0004091057|nr:SIS domain-containing protein [Thalassobaculum salexigens]
MAALGYFDRMRDTVGGVQVSDAAGAPVDLDSAIGRLVGRFAALPAAGAKAVIVGNGGSAAIASHFATDFSKNGKVPTLAFSDAALLTCISNDLGYENVYARPIELFGKPGDLLLAISSSGSSANILTAARAARDGGMEVVTMSGFRPDNPLRSMGALNFYINSDSYGFVECSHFMLCHLAIDLLTGAWPEHGDRDSETA